MLSGASLECNWISGTMPTSTCFGLFIFLIILFSVQCKNSTESIQTLFEKGVNAYLDNSYADCVMFFEEAVEKYQIYTRKVQYCRLKCHDEVSLADPLYHTNIDDLFFFEKTIKNTLCIIKCKSTDTHIFAEFNLDQDIVDKFEKRIPYEYLHICYFHNDEPQKAASAAFTFLVTNPNDQAMIHSLQYYSKLPQVEMGDIINFEAKDFVYLYVHGTNAYELKNWDEVIQNMEQSLSSYLLSEDECRAQCEGPFDQGWFPDFIPSIANHFTHVLRCKRKCKDNLSTLNGEKHDDLFASHYHYLQFAYFKAGNLRAACEAVASYLLFYPHDETMLYNMEYYKKLPKFKDSYFKARPEAVRYMHRDNYEELLLNYITKMFDPGETIADAAEKYKALYLKKSKKIRFVVDDFINQQECATLLGTVQNYSLAGDGYTGKIQPHTIYENYEGLSLERVNMLMTYHLIDRNVLNSLLSITSNIKKFLTNYFELNKRLHFTFTQLVCRSAVTGSQNNRTDFSHAVHADNCNIQIDGTCPKTSPAFTWRDYTAILYLNSDFIGGELFFSKDTRGDKIEKTVRPLCGRLVGFTSGNENLHGVKAIKKGKRCALAIWFTHDQKHSENERKLFLKYYKV